MTKLIHADKARILSGDTKELYSQTIELIATEINAAIARGEYRIVYEHGRFNWLTTDDEADYANRPFVNRVIETLKIMGYKAMIQLKTCDDQVWCHLVIRWGDMTTRQEFEGHKQAKHWSFRRSPIGYYYDSNVEWAWIGFCMARGESHLQA